MNRRNFLKLFGIGLLPVPALAVPTVETPLETVDESVEGDWADWMTLKHGGDYRIQIDNQFVCCLSDQTAEDIEEHHQFQHRILGYGELYDGREHSDVALLVSKESIIYVTPVDGTALCFRPLWCPVEKRFKTVHIKQERFHDRYLSDDGGAVYCEVNYTKLFAYDEDGQPIQDADYPKRNEE